jgi:hypothetical protein
MPSSGLDIARHMYQSEWSVCQEFHQPSNGYKLSLVVSASFTNLTIYNIMKFFTTAVAFVIVALAGVAVAGEFGGGQQDYDMEGSPEYGGEE